MHEKPKQFDDLRLLVRISKIAAMFVAGGMIWKWSFCGIADLPTRFLIAALVAYSLWAEYALSSK